MNVRFHCLGLFLVVVSAFVYAEEKVHIVRSGDTIYSIARSYGTTPDEVIRLNGIADPSRIQAGQRIRIPQGRAAGGAASGGAVEYRASRGDTLIGIARRYGITLGALRQANGLSENYVLKEGERLRVPLGQLLPAQPVISGGTSRGPLPADINFGDVVPRTGTAAPADQSIRWPVAAKEVMYMTGKLYGVVLLGERSESVRSLTQGTVVSAGPYRGFGKVAIVQMAGGYLYVYGGCESLSVREGDRVGPGTELGRLGIDGVSSKPQLFFLVYQSNTPIDPAKAPRAS